MPTSLQFGACEPGRALKAATGRRNPPRRRRGIFAGNQNADPVTVFLMACREWLKYQLIPKKFMTNKFPKNIMKNTYWLAWSLIVLALAASAPGQSAVTSVPAGRSLETPMNNILVLSNATGEVRVLDSKGLVLEKNLVFLPRIPLADLSPAQLQALLETKTAYATLTAFGSVSGTNAQGAQGAVMEHQLQQTWHQGQSLAGKIQTRLEILEDLRDYKNEIALLPASIAAASQYAANDIAINDQLTNRAATAVVAAAQVEVVERYKAAGGANAELAEQQAQENYEKSAARVEVANNQAISANGQIARANQQITDHLAKCATLATRLASHGINVPGVPPFYPIPPLAMRTEVDAERTAN